MKKYCVLGLVLLHATAWCVTSAVTYSGAAGRFGDQLYVYSKAKWVAHKYGLPLYIQPTFFDDQLLFSEKETYLTPAIQSQYQKIITIADERNIQPDANCLYVVDFFFRPSVGFFEFEFEHTPEVLSFLDQLKQTIAPKAPFAPLALPPDSISVAVHVRKGSGGDMPLSSQQIYKSAADKQWPTKFPPDQFYIDQIKKVALLFPDKKLYVYIFTDYVRPEEIVQRYAGKINNPHIYFDSRKSCLQKTDTILQDFFAMAQFDCLIRPQSAFSIIAQLIGNHQLVLFPKAGYWQENKLIISQVGVMRR